MRCWEVWGLPGDTAGLGLSPRQCASEVFALPHSTSGDCRLYPVPSIAMFHAELCCTPPPQSSLAHNRCLVSECFLEGWGQQEVQRLLRAQSKVSVIFWKCLHLLEV